MRTTVTIEDTLLESASAATGEKNVSALVSQALELVVSVESAKRLMALSGKAPEFSVPERSSRTGLSRVAEEKSAYGSPSE